MPHPCSGVCWSWALLQQPLPGSERNQAEGRGSPLLGSGPPRSWPAGWGILPCLKRDSGGGGIQQGRQLSCGFVGGWCTLRSLSRVSKPNRFLPLLACQTNTPHETAATAAFQGAPHLPSVAQPAGGWQWKATQNYSHIPETRGHVRGRPFPWLPAANSPAVHSLQATRHAALQTGHTGRPLDPPAAVKPRGRPASPSTCSTS